MISDDRLLFEGGYLEGKRNGYGKEYNYIGALIFKGEYRKGRKWNGIGYICENNDSYEIKNGKGKIIDYYHYNKLKYECDYLKEEKNGKEKQYDIDGYIYYKCEYLNGEKHGQIKEYFEEDKLKFEGECVYGKLWNVKGYDTNNKILY